MVWVSLLQKVVIADLAMTTFFLICIKLDRGSEGSHIPAMVSGKTPLLTEMRKSDNIQSKDRTHLNTRGDLIMQYPADLNLLLQKYEDVSSKEDLYIKKMLEDTVELFQLCDRNEYYYADMITRNLCRVIGVMEKQHNKDKHLPEDHCKQSTVAAQFVANADRAMRFTCDQELARAFYNHFKTPEQVDYEKIADALESGRRDLVNPTMKDYVARIYTFSGPKYLGEMFSREALGQIHPVLFTYQNIEYILATFQTRDSDGQIVKQRVNIRSALRKLNEFKQHQER